MPESKRVELLKEELALMKSLRGLAEHIPLDLEDENLSSLTSLLSQRKSILEEISRCQERMEKAGTFPLGPGEEEELVDIINEIKSTHADIAELNQELGQRLSKEKDQVFEKIRQIRHSHQTLKGYSSKRTNIPRYCDKKG